MPEPDLLSCDHKFIDKISDQVFAALEAVDHQLVLARLDYFWGRLAMHIRAEHLHLFPALLKAPLPENSNDEKASGNATSLESVIEQLRRDHNFFMSELAKAVNMVRKIQDDDNGDSMLSLVEVKQRVENVGRRLMIHNDLEEAQIYPLAELLFEPEQAAEIRGKMKKELDNLPSRFVNNAKTG